MDEKAGVSFRSLQATWPNRMDVKTAIPWSSLANLLLGTHPHETIIGQTIESKCSTGRTGVQKNEEFLRSVTIPEVLWEKEKKVCATVKEIPMRYIILHPRTNVFTTICKGNSMNN